MTNRDKSIFDLSMKQWEKLMGYDKPLYKLKRLFILLKLKIKENRRKK